jgi:aspartate/methionine/tyrosine aminotransferase
VTGWQVGWAVGPAALIQPIQAFLPLAQFCVATPLQEALAIALDVADKPLFADTEGAASQLIGSAAGFERNPGAPLVDYYSMRRAQYARKREKLADALSAAGIRPLPCAGGFFTMGETSALRVPSRYLAQTTAAAPEMRRDWALCRWMAEEHGVLLIPASPFFSDGAKHLGANLVRVAFCKTDETLDRAYARLSAFGAAHAPDAARRLVGARAALAPVEPLVAPRAAPSTLAK